MFLATDKKDQLTSSRCCKKLGRIRSPEQTSTTEQMSVWQQIHRH